MLIPDDPEARFQALWERPGAFWLDSAARPGNVSRIGLCDPAPLSSLDQVPPRGPAVLALTYEADGSFLAPVQWVEEFAATPPEGEAPPARPVGAAVSNLSRDEYLARVHRIKEYIAAGDCYQVNLSQQFSAPLSGSPFDLYRRLRRRSPAAYAAFLHLPGGTFVLSSSPELFLALDPATRRVATRPIKGTRPRGATPEEDRRLADELAASEKDRAENVMIVDLLRNDLGRVCRFGSVRVDALWRVETHPTVHHLVSDVSGTLRAGCGPADLLAAAFPGGSITGAPKVRAMEIIDELEPHRRGFYCGSLGWLDNAGGLTASISIRTMVARDGTVTFCAGGGIVADSDPEDEYRETLAKARAMAEACGATLPD